MASSPEFSPVHCGGASPLTPVPSNRSDLEEGRYYGEALICPNVPASSSQMLSPRGMQQFSNELQLRLALNKSSDAASSVSGAESIAGPSVTSPERSPPPPPIRDPLIRALLDLLVIILEGLLYSSFSCPFSQPIR